jgi:hypothetical protein
MDEVLERTDVNSKVKVLTYVCTKSTKSACILDGSSGPWKTTKKTTTRQREDLIIFFSERKKYTYSG